MEKAKILEMLENHPIVQDLLDREETEIAEKRKVAIAQRNEAIARLEKEATARAGKIEAIKKITDDARAAFQAKEKAFEAAILERLQVIGSIEHEVKRLEIFLKESSNPIIDEFKHELIVLIDVIRHKDSQIYSSEQYDILTERKKVTSSSTWESAKDGLEYLRTSLKRLDELHLVTTEEALHEIQEIKEGIPNYNEVRSVTFTPGAYEVPPPKKRPPERKPSWIDISE